MTSAHFSAFLAPAAHDATDPKPSSSHVGESAHTPSDYHKPPCTTSLLTHCGATSAPPGLRGCSFSSISIYCAGTMRYPSSRSFCSSTGSIGTAAPNFRHYP
eukprot:8145068-Pyramimonas_sp.AAC.1